MLAHPTNPDLALNLPHLEEKKIQHEVVIMEVEQNKSITLGLFQKLTCGGGGWMAKNFSSGWGYF